MAKVKTDRAIQIMVDGGTADRVREVADSLGIDVSELGRSFIPPPDFLRCLAELPVFALRVFVNQCLELGLREFMRNDADWPLVAEQLAVHRGGMLFELFVAWRKAQRSEKGYSLCVVVDDDKVRGCRVDYPLKLSKSMSYEDNQRATLRESFPKLSEQQIDEMMKVVKERWVTEVDEKGQPIQEK